MWRGGGARARAYSGWGDVEQSVRGSRVRSMCEDRERKEREEERGEHEGWRVAALQCRLSAVQPQREPGWEAISREEREREQAGR